LSLVCFELSVCLCHRNASLERAVAGCFVRVSGAPTPRGLISHGGRLALRGTDQFAVISVLPAVFSSILVLMWVVLDGAS
jgi:hypothetical protein